MQAIQTSSKIFFPHSFKIHLIERELLTYFLTLASTSLRSKNTTYEKGIIFRNVQNFALFFYSASALKTE
jgi:hypothetical protein